MHNVNTAIIIRAIELSVCYLLFLSLKELLYQLCGKHHTVEVPEFASICQIHLNMYMKIGVYAGNLLYLRLII